MGVTVTGSPVVAFGDAIYARLAADVTLAALATGGVYGALPRNARVAKPYVVVGRRELRGGYGGMQLEGGSASVWVDVWSDYDGPAQAQDIQARIRVLLQRQDITVPGFSLMHGSVVCDEELCFAEPDTDMPERNLTHGVQRWQGDLEELA